MSILQAIILGLVQGATEFIPVSSSAHLVLVPWLLGWPAPGLAFDTVLHLGTLLAVVAVFWRDFWALAKGWWHTVEATLLQTAASATGVGPAHTAATSSNATQADKARILEEGRLAWWIILGTVPAAVMGALWEDRFEALFHTPLHVAALLLVTGLWLLLAERLGKKNYNVQDLEWWQSLLVGLAQGCAIAPGVSRSGATIGAAMLLGLRREAATRFSFLLATPIILGAGALQTKRLLASYLLPTQYLPLVLGFLAAFAAGYVCIRFLMNYVTRRGLGDFSWYCWGAGLGAILIYLVR